MLFLPPSHVVAVATEMHVSLVGLDGNPLFGESAANAGARDAESRPSRPMPRDADIEVLFLLQADCADRAIGCRVFGMTVDAVRPQGVCDLYAANRAEGV